MTTRRSFFVLLGSAALAPMSAMTPSLRSVTIPAGIKVKEAILSSGMTWNVRKIVNSAEVEDWLFSLDGVVPNLPEDYEFVRKSS